MKPASLKLRRLLPIHPDYAPFGWPWLRGLNALAFMIYVPYILGRSLWDLKDTLSFRGERRSGPPSSRRPPGFQANFSLFWSASCC